MPDAELGEQGVDRPDLQTTAAAGRAQAGGGDVVIAVGDEQRQGGEPARDPLAVARAVEPLEQLLQHEPGRDHQLARPQGVSERSDLGHVGRVVSPQGERPDARVDEQRQARERSAV